MGSSYRLPDRGGDEEDDAAEDTMEPLLSSSSSSGSDVPPGAANRDFVDLAPHCRCRYTRLDEKGHCIQCRLRQATYTRIVYEAVEDQLAHGEFSGQLAYQMFDDERKMEREVMCAVFKWLSLSEQMDGRKVTLKQVVALVDSLTQQAYAAWVRRRTPLLVAIAKPAVDQVIKDHFPGGGGDQRCVLAAAADFREPPKMRERAEQYVLSFLDGSCKGHNSAADYKVVAHSAAQKFVHQWICEDQQPLNYTPR
jgi:hypothetical protein